MTIVPTFRFGRAAIDTDFDESTLVPPWDVKRAPTLPIVQNSSLRSTSVAHSTRALQQTFCIKTDKRDRRHTKPVRPR